MKIISLVFLIITALPFMAAAETILVGNIPGQYVEGVAKDEYALAQITISKRVITEIKKISLQKALALFKSSTSNTNLIVAASAPKTEKDFDVLYPGLIDLHGHTKQNNLSVWKNAKGQFKNRFEWRAWSIYKKSVSGNMNPWVGYGKPITCAAFRWSEIQAMVLGTTYLQGPSSCVTDFGIHKVEDKNAYISERPSVLAPTDLVVPADMVFVWSLKDQIKAHQASEGIFAYEAALSDYINAHCTFPATVKIDKVSVGGRGPHGVATLKVLKDQALLKAHCQNVHPKFVRYVYWLHPGLANKKKTLVSNSGEPTKATALIAHLAEGRHDDEYNQKEYEIVKLLGFNVAHVNFVHGVGIPKEDHAELARKEIGIIWSPFSNMLLYANTANIHSLKTAGVRIAIGSDWVPTGSKSVLEEVKLAAEYVDKNPEGTIYGTQSLKALPDGKPLFNDEELYKMMTENPAQMINHWTISDKEAGIGRLAVGAMGSVIAVKRLHEDPYTNIVRHAYEKDVNLVVVDGKVQYGNESYLKQAGATYEILPRQMYDMAHFRKDEAQVPAYPAGKIAAKEKAAILEQLGRAAQQAKLSFKTAKTQCTFEEDKGLVQQNSDEQALKDFKTATQLDLETFDGIQKILAVSMMTHSRNRKDPVKGDIEFQIGYFPPIYSCAEVDNEGNFYHRERLLGMVKNGQKSDELSENQKNHDSANPDSLRKKQNLGSVPEKLKKAYK